MPFDMSTFEFSLYLISRPPFRVTCICAQLIIYSLYMHTRICSQHSETIFCSYEFKSRFVANTRARPNSKALPSTFTEKLRESIYMALLKF